LDGVERLLQHSARRPSLGESLLERSRRVITYTEQAQCFRLGLEPPELAS
jgi:hypothetical protein